MFSMRYSRLLLRFLFSTLFIGLFASSTLAALPEFVTLSKELKPAVVNINTTKKAQIQQMVPPGFGGQGNELFDDFFKRFFGGQQNGPRESHSLGSGFVIDAQGHIVTNAHVIDGADEINVTLSDGSSHPATVIGADKKLDLALLKIEIDVSPPFVRLGDSDTLQVGEWVIAIGNPFGLEQTVTAGIISAKGRVIGAGPYDDFIQTDASINPGNSGGPLFNTSGEVVGINTAIIARGQGIGFAIPVNVARLVIDQLKETGHVTRGWLGVSIQVVDENLAESLGLDAAGGALITEVFSDSPAEKAGFMRQDVIVAFNGKSIDHVRDLPRIVAATPVGKKVTVTVIRNGKKIKLYAVVSKMDEEQETVATHLQKGKSTFGVSVSPLTPDLAERNDLENGQGVVVTSIDPESTAAEANLRQGDIILEINRKPIRSPKDFRKVLTEQQGKKPLLLIKRGGQLYYTTFLVGS
jgi:serine protease Do